MSALEIERGAAMEAVEQGNGHNPIRIKNNRAQYDIHETNSTWWIAAAYNITAIVGLGVLVLPNAMVFLSWGGVVVLALACMMTYFTMQQLVELHEIDPGERYETYHSLAQRALGDTRGLWIVLPLQLIVEFSLDVLYTVAAGEAMIRIVGSDCGQQPSLAHQVPIYIWFAVFAAIQVGLSFMLPTYSSMKWIAVVAALMSVCYSTIAWISLVSAKHGLHEPPVSHSLPKNLKEHNMGAHLGHTELSQTDLVFQAFNAMGVIAFAYAAHNIVLDVQSNLPSPSKKAMMKGVRFTYLVVALCYFPMAIAVYGVYGNKISHNVLGFMMGKVSRGWVITTNVMLIIHLFGSYQIFAIPVFKVLEVLFTNYPPYIIRIVYIAFTTLIAIIFPFFSPLLGFFGGLAIAPTTYILPCVLWLRIKGYSNGWTRTHYINWVCIILGTLLMIFAIMGGISILSKEMTIYTFYNLYKKSPKWENSGFYPNCTKA